MKLSIKILITSFLISLVGCTNVTTYEPPMYQIQFGLLQKNDAGKYAINETNSISHVFGTDSQMFGYLITPKHDNKYVYNAIVVLPNTQPKLETNVMDNNEPAIPQEIDMGVFEGQGPSTIKMWLTDGDTKGIHKIRLFINGSPADSREFMSH